MNHEHTKPCGSYRHPCDPCTSLERIAELREDISLIFPLFGEVPFQFFPEVLPLSCKHRIASSRQILPPRSPGRLLTYTIEEQNSRLELYRCRRNSRN